MFTNYVNLWKLLDLTGSEFLHLSSQNDMYWVYKKVKLFQFCNALVSIV